MKSLIPTSVLSIVAAAARPTALDTSHNVTYNGIYLDQIETFLSIPYGQDTSGEHRFKQPRPYIPYPGSTITATSRGPACPQETGSHGFSLYLGNVTDISEDCLHLNVYRPNGTNADDRLPVLVHIHGGSFIGSSKDEPVIQPGGMILQSLANGFPLMVVNINYRLGVFGFAKSAALVGEGSTNAGLNDQRLALEWVKKNIEIFGGDCERITIFGQSSGGLAVGLQVMAYGASRPFPFQKAICESQALEPGITGNFTEKAMQRVANAVRCNTTSIQSEPTIACLRNLTMEELLAAQTNTHKADPGANIGDEWLPIVDGDILPEAPTTLISQGRFANIPFMIGWCEDDTTPFLDTTIQTENDTQSFITHYAPDLTPSHVQHLLSLYPISDFEANLSANLSAQFYRSTRILRDILMVCQPFYYGQAVAAQGNDVYLYDQNQTLLTEALDSVGTPGLGVVHTSEFAYIFGNLSHYNVDDIPYHPNASDFALRDRESRSWSSFANFGRPSLDGHNTLRDWTPSFTRRNQTDIFVIGGPNEGLSAIDGPHAHPAVSAQKLRERCGFINSPEVIKQWNY